MIDFDTPALKRYRLWRYSKDRMTRVAVEFGGIGILAAILTIFVYLVYEVVPLFKEASVEVMEPLPYQEAPLQKPLYMSIEEQGEVAFRLGQGGEARFLNVADGRWLLTQNLPLTAEATSFALLSESSGAFAVGQANGKALVVKQRYSVSYPDNKRLITPSLDYPFGESGVELDSAGRALQKLAYQDGDTRTVFAGQLADGELMVWVFTKEEDFLTEEVTLERHEATAPKVSAHIRKMAMDGTGRWLYVLTEDNHLHVLDIGSAEDGEVALVDTVDFSANPATDMEMMTGGITLLVTRVDGSLGHWFMSRNPDGHPYFANVREFSSNGTVVDVVPEQRRKGFISLGDDGLLGIFNGTAHRQLFAEKVTAGKPAAMALTPRANKLIVELEDGRFQVVLIDNKHPEVSLSSLWEEIWYENYDKPSYTWQSSAANSDFEPKYSLMPLAFGTLKAAFYAMLLGAPLAICGAIYTAYFMSPAMRQKVKPLVELMAALPTVILGFLAGLWLAPFMEMHLAAIFAVLLLMPIGVLAAAFLYTRLPSGLRHRVPDGWEAALLIPVVIAICWACIAANGYMEYWFFDGDMRSWITNDLGITFDQRNAMVVGIAMGIAVIPNIFSIAEDAIFSVPKHLSHGSLALGATPWQTLVGVVLPTASPGIFSALMIGLGRAVGETMIVLMATGNTPVMEVNIFEGMRTLAANIAVEMPEAEVNSSHYRVLFLAALVLFAFTFVLNTAAETVRQRLRQKYGQI